MDFGIRDEHGERDQRRGFTVLELLVVSAIFSLLVALLLPALIVARESARCLQCKSNLREIGVAIQQCYNSERKLPAAWRVASDRNSGYGWTVGLLPYLEEPALGSRINCNLSVSADHNEFARNTIFPLMRCPSDISESMFDLLVELPSTSGPSGAGVGTSSTEYENTPLVRLPTANYVGVFGTLRADKAVPAPAGDGPIVSHRPVRYSDLQHGLSHTIIVGERTTAMVPSTWYGVDFRGEDAACRLVGSAISSPNCETCDECEFGSRHPGGSNFVWADGHVTLVRNDIDPTEYQRLSRRKMN